MMVFWALPNPPWPRPLRSITNIYRFRIQVHVVPGHTQKLSLSGRCRDCQEEQGLQPVFSARLEERLGLQRGDDRRVPPRPSWEVNQASYVAYQIVLPHRFFEQSMNAGIVVPNTLWRVAPRYQVGIEGFQVGWGELSKAFMAQGWNDVDPERCFVALIGLRSL